MQSFQSQKLDEPSQQQPVGHPLGWWEQVSLCGTLTLGMGRQDTAQGQAHVPRLKLLKIISHCQHICAIFFLK